NASYRGIYTQRARSGLDPDGTLGGIALHATRGTHLDRSTASVGQHKTVGLPDFDQTFAGMRFHIATSAVHNDVAAFGGQVHCSDAFANRYLAADSAAGSRAAHAIDHDRSRAIEELRRATNPAHANLAAAGVTE